MRFPEFSGEWDSFKLVELGKFIGGGTPSSSNLSFWTGSIPWISSSDIKEDNINNISISRYITEDAIEKSATKYCPAPVILIVSRVGVGKVALSHTSLCTSQDFCNIIDIKCHPVFLSYNLLRTMKRKSREVQGTSIKGITSDELQKIRVFIPKNKDEQNKISNLLTLLDERIVTQNKIIEDLKKLKSAIRKRVFSLLKDEYTESFEINQLLAYEQPSTYLVANDEYSKDITLIPVLTANKGFILGYTDEDFGVYQKGECIIFDDFTMDAKYVSFPFKVKSSAIKILTAKPCVNLRFMFEYLSYLELKSEEHKRHYISEIASLVIEIPSLKRQNEIAFLMTSLDNKLTLEENAKVRYENEKQYLLSQMFI
ncbi:restriction endonuclease subunit S [Bacteroides salyersiae]|uniref:restriction endonuclease subunit S n=1 Tax=Bacteroides salyersiae TaxID=291644 RepID=UPI0015FD2D73|nr:restriction endonuclease subunit S [Bacteroides salyersiae]